MPIKSSSFSPVYNTNANGDLVVEVLNNTDNSSNSQSLAPNAATATNQSTEIGYLLSVDTKITSTNADLSLVKTTVATINSNVSNIKDNVASVLPFIGLDTTAIRAQLPTTLGPKTSSNSLAVTLSTDSIVNSIFSQIGEVTEAPTTNTVLARLKTISDRLPAVGVQAASASLSITPASNAVFTLAAEAGYLTTRTTVLTNAPQTIKTSAGSIMGWNFINVNTSAVYVKLYNALIGNVTVGATTPLLTIAVPAGSATNPGINMVTPDLVPFEVFSSAISFACVTGLADNSNTAPTTAIHASVRYK
jgi:hypothetical protein